MADETKFLGYQSTMAQVRIMLRNGILSRAEYLLIEHKLAEQYGLKTGSIYREIDLISTEP